jgi:hypothetical protein
MEMRRGRFAPQSTFLAAGHHAKKFGPRAISLAFHRRGPISLPGAIGIGQNDPLGHKARIPTAVTTKTRSSTVVYF